MTEHVDEPARYAPDPVALRRDPQERSAARWLVPLAAVTGLLVLVMIWYLASRQY